jgi:hypothetical protein
MTTHQGPPGSGTQALGLFRTGETLFRPWRFFRRPGLAMVDPVWGVLLIDVVKKKSKSMTGINLTDQNTEPRVSPR